MWWCISIPSLVTKCLVLHKVSFRHAFIDTFNLHYDLDLDHSNPIFSHDTRAYDDVPSNKVWLQKDKHFRRYCSNILIIYTLIVTWTLKLAHQFFRMTLHLMMIHHQLPYQVWVQKVQRFRWGGKKEYTCNCVANYYVNNCIYTSVQSDFIQWSRKQFIKYTFYFSWLQFKCFLVFICSITIQNETKTAI